jgi:hypothetical protein
LEGRTVRTEQEIWIAVLAPTMAVATLPVVGPGGAIFVAGVLAIVLFVVIEAIEREKERRQYEGERL